MPTSWRGLKESVGNYIRLQENASIMMPGKIWGVPFPCNTGNTCHFLQPYNLLKTSETILYTMPKHGDCFYGILSFVFFSPREMHTRVEPSHDCHKSPCAFGTLHQEILSISMEFDLKGLYNHTMEILLLSGCLKEG